MALLNCLHSCSCVLVALQDIYQYCAFALILQLGLFVLYLSRARRHAQTAGMVVQRLVEVVIAAVPSQIPAVIDLAVLRCAIVLQGQNIHIHDTAGIKNASAAEVVVFDKTGTLTGSIVRSRPKAYHMRPVLRMCNDCMTEIFTRCVQRHGHNPDLVSAVL